MNTLLSEIPPHPFLLCSENVFSDRNEKTARYEAASKQLFT